MRPRWVAAVWSGAVLLGVGAAYFQHRGTPRQVDVHVDADDPPCPYVVDHSMANFHEQDRLMRRSQCWEPM